MMLAALKSWWGTVVLVSFLVVWTGHAYADPVAASAADLAVACREAKSSITDLTAADLARTRGELQAAAARLDERLKTAGPVGEQWREYLRWDRLQAILAAAEPDLEAIDEVHNRFLTGIEGLNLVWFADVRQALRQYRLQARSIGRPTFAQECGLQLDRLAGLVEAYRAAPAAQTASEMSEALEWLADRGQAEAIVERVRGELSHPNLYVEVSAGLVSAALSRPVDDVGPVRETIVGTDVHGVGHTVGAVTAELVPADEYAEIQAVLRGRIDLDSIGYNGPARIYGRAKTDVVGRLAFRLNAERFWAEPPQTQATTDTTVDSVCAVRGGMLVACIAQRQAAKKECQAEWESSRKAERRVNRRMLDEAEEPLRLVRDVFVNKFRRPLNARKLFPPLLKFRTTREALLVTAMQAGPYHLAAPAPPPEPPVGGDLTVRMHESMVNNFAESAFGATVVNTARMKSMAVSFLGEVPKEMEAQMQDTDWSIILPRRQPVVVGFGDGQIRVTMRPRAFRSGGQTFSGLDITALYTVARREDGFHAVRQGAVVFHPTGTDPSAADQLSPADLAKLRRLEPRVNQLLRDDWRVENLVAPPRFAGMRPLALDQWRAENGWVAMTWKMLPPAPQP